MANPNPSRRKRCPDQPSRTPLLWGGVTRDTKFSTGHEWRVRFTETWGTRMDVTGSMTSACDDSATPIARDQRASGASSRDGRATERELNDDHPAAVTVQSVRILRVEPPASELVFVRIRSNCHPVRREKIPTRSLEKNSIVRNSFAKPIPRRHVVVCMTFSGWVRRSQPADR